MAETVVSNPRGAEISERSDELVLPGDRPSPLRVVASPEPRTPSNGAAQANGEREFGVSDSEFIATDPTAPRTPLSAPATPPASAATTASATPPSSSDTTQATTAARGMALPGDRVNRGAGAASPPTSHTTDPNATTQPAQRPSFWRRIALGRRGAAAEPNVTTTPDTPSAQPAPDPNQSPIATTTRGLAARARSAVAPAPDTSALETRIVEPMLQALVSVEAKLERSHGDLMGRSDQVEQRLTQLWDIEEQLGTLGELQESLLQVSEQQRRLESAVVGQTRTLRWLIGAVFFSLAAAAFVVAAIR